MASDAHHMQCMEVWGGNQLADNGVVLSGLDAWVYSKPFGGATGGGDVYYVSSCATGRITRLLVADVSGHGSKVSDVAKQLRGLMRRHVNQINQSKFVQSMNQQFATLAATGQFATAVVTTFFAPTNQLSLCNAGHPPPLVYRSQKGQWSFLEQRVSANESFGNIPLGIMDLINYDQFDVRLNVGDLVLCYTDSLIEACNADAGMLGPRGLLEMMHSLDMTQPTQVIAQLLAKLEAYCDGQLCADDVTMLLFRPNGTAPNTPLRERLLAPWRILKSIIESLLPGGDPAAWPDASVANLGGAAFSPLSRVEPRRRAPARPRAHAKA